MLTPDPVLFSFRLYSQTPIVVTPWTFIGLVANALFTARVIIQWIASERQRKSIAPVTFWWCSLIATVIMIFYSIQRFDVEPGVVAFLLGYSINVLPYTRNLALIYAPRRRWHVASYVLSAAIFLYSLTFLRSFNLLPEGATAWVYLGLAGNAVWSTRFIPQWIYSEKKRQSVLPMWFWIWSLAGQMLCLAYALILHDLVFILGFLFNGIPIIRNIMLIRQHGSSADAEH
jgi:lipid-A-disaccharide synthase-like uncharacterized protein